MNPTPDPEDPLRSLLNEHWSPTAVEPAEFSNELQARLRAKTMRGRIVWAAAIAAAALVLLTLIPRAPSTVEARSPTWLPYTTASASSPLPLPDDYAAIQAIFVSEGER